MLTRTKTKENSSATGTNGAVKEIDHEDKHDIKLDEVATSVPRPRKTKNCASSSSNLKQWAMILPDKMAVGGNLGDSDVNGSTCKLPHPRSGNGCLFLFCGREVYEVLQFKEAFHSWFVDDTVQKDGSLILTSPVDPLFLVIPYLEKASVMNKFTTIDQILVDKKYSHTGKLERCVRNEDLCNVCDSKGSDDLLVYRLNEDRLIAWLMLKVERLASHLKKSNVHVTTGSQVATLVRSTKDNDIRESDYLRYAFGLVSDYLAPTWIEKLGNRLQIEDKGDSISGKNVPEEPPSKKQRKDTSQTQACVEDYRKFNTDKDSKSKVTPALTTAQKKLAKIDKSGMKSLTSFFTPKGKK